MAIQRTSEEDRNRERKRIADELLAFRQKYLFTQIKMAEALGISRRALQYAEAGVALLQMSTRAPNRLALSQIWLVRMTAMRLMTPTSAESHFVLVKEFPLLVVRIFGRGLQRDGGSGCPTTQRSTSNGQITCLVRVH